MVSFGMEVKGQTRKIIHLDEMERTVLLRRSNSHRAESRDKLRANIILLKSEGKTQQQVSDELGVARRTVMKWTDRFLENRLEGLFDAPGRGRKPSVSEETNNQIITKATQPPENMSRWSTRTMAKELGVSNYHVAKI
jgi:transposase